MSKIAQKSLFSSEPGFISWPDEGLYPGETAGSGGEMASGTAGSRLSGHSSTQSTREDEKKKSE